MQTSWMIARELTTNEQQFRYKLREVIQPVKKKDTESDAPLIRLWLGACIRYYLPRPASWLP